MTVMAGVATFTGAVGLYPLFAEGGWLWGALGSVIAVGGGGMLARRLRLPAVLNPLLGLAALLLYLNAVHAGAQSWLGIIPSPASLRYLGEVAADGWHAANRYAAPVPLVPGIALLAAGGVGLVAVLVDLLAVRLRRAAPAGLPLLAMYSVPAAVREDGAGWAAFGLGALGFLALLMADAREQVGGWGRLVGSAPWSGDVPMAGTEPEEPPAAGPRGGGLAARGWRIACAAVAVAVLVPALVPGLQPRGMFGLGGDGEGGGGAQTVTTPDPLVSLKRELTRLDDSIVLTYRSDDPDGPDYLRLYALDRFDGDRWTYSALKSSGKDRLRGRALPRPPGLGLVRTRQVTTRVRVRPEVRNMTFLPLPYAPERVSVEGDWRVHAPSRMVYSLRDSAGGRSYTVRSVRARPTAGDLATAGNYPAEIVSLYTAVPRNVPPEIRALAGDITADAATAHGQAVALQRWFTETGGFLYDLSAPAPQHGSDLADFLLRGRRGYCEQFAASFALMARLLGIPSRVAMGYTPGTQVRPGEWVVRSRDAHAWPELYFEGSGWVRFEPTPAGTAGQGTAVAPPYSRPATGSGAQQPDAGSIEPGAPGPEDEPTAAPGASADPRRDGGGDTGPAGVRDEGDDGFAMVPWLAAGVLLALLAAAPMVVRALTRRRRWAVLAPSGTGGTPGAVSPAPAVAAHAAWREMRADALDHGFEWRASDSPRAAARRLGELLELDEEGTRALGRIARAEELARYSRTRPAEPAERLRTDVRTVREAFAASVGRRTRWRARLLPPSTVAQTRESARGAADRAARIGERAGAAARRLGGLADRVNALPGRLRRRP
ncbi:transglutaminaseTgpA domain-containing protein [Spirillospora albida]|uniref:transglutaminase family protein n=1 Tax=Spirillospora albida TaxID=58123 RepID=UPI00055BF64B|nr:DUF3488 and transglutaminase-like domain-containing protein [Spirillospora albida]